MAPIMQSTKIEDRRSEKRLRLGLHVVEVEGRDKYFQYATNLSAGGMFLSGTLPSSLGTQVTLIFRLPGDNSPVALPAEVVGNKSGNDRGTHFKFVDPDDSAARGHIRAYVDRHHV